MKIRLLNDGGFLGMKNIKFPIEVNGKPYDYLGFDVSVRELNKHGYVGCNDDFLYFSLLEGECEVIEE